MKARSKNSRRADRLWSDSFRAVHRTSDESVDLTLGMEGVRKKESLVDALPKGIGDSQPEVDRCHFQEGPSWTLSRKALET